MSTQKNKNLLEQNWFKYTSALLKLLRATSRYRQLLKDIGPVQVPVWREMGNSISVWNQGKISWGEPRVRQWSNYLAFFLGLIWGSLSKNKVGLIITVPVRYVCSTCDEQVLFLKQCMLIAEVVLGEKRKGQKIRMLFSKNPTLKANKRWGTAKNYVGRERRGKGWWKKLNMNQKCHCDGEKNKGKQGPDICMEHNLQQGQSNCSAWCRGSISLAGVCVLIWAVHFRKAVGQLGGVRREQ